MFTITTDHLKVEFLPKAELSFVTTYEFATIRCENIRADEYGFVEFCVDDDALTTIQLLEEESDIIQLFSDSLIYCEQREIGGKQFAYAPVCKLISVDEKVGKVQFQNGAMYFTPDGEESRKLNLNEHDCFTLLGFISSLDSILQERLESYNTKYNSYPDWFVAFKELSKQKLEAYREQKGSLPVWYESVLSDLLD
jgi:hypothetical protein